MKRLSSNPTMLIIAAMCLLTACGKSEKSVNESEALLSLKEAFKDDFYIGTALNYDQVYGKEEAAMTLVKAQFNSISPENMLKMGPVHPKQDIYNFEAADKYVEFGIENDMFIIGHALVWHSQAPGWIYIDEEGTTVSRDTLILRMKNYIHAVAGR